MSKGHEELEEAYKENAKELPYMTLAGFRRMGHAMQALAVNPANILAQSYMGQGLVEKAKIADALVQLRAIRDHGGNGSWVEGSLRTAIATGQTYNY